MLIRTAVLLGLVTAAGLSPAFAAPGLSFGSQSPNIGGTIVTPRGPGVVTGTLGSTATTSIPGSGGQGLLMNNGNGTSTLIVTGGVPQTVPTPK
jgi:hypothetical protein